MSSFYVKPEFLKKLQPFICGEGVLSTDAPYCKEEPEDIDFKSYYNGKKLAGYIPDWVPGNNAQAIMRCHRIGQTRPVLARFVALAGGADERISNVLKRKTRELSALFDN